MHSSFSFKVLSVMAHGDASFSAQVRLQQRLIVERIKNLDCAADSAFYGAVFN